jgi:hypothetical protein
MSSLPVPGYFFEAAKSFEFAVLAKACSRWVSTALIRSTRAPSVWCGRWRCSRRADPDRWAFTRGCGADCVARLNPNGAVDSFLPVGANSDVRAVVVQAGTGG